MDKGIRSKRATLSHIQEPLAVNLTTTACAGLRPRDGETLKFGRALPVSEDLRAGQCPQDRQIFAAFR